MSAEDNFMDVQDISATVGSSHLSSGEENAKDVSTDVNKIPLTSDSDNMLKTAEITERKEVELCNGDCDKTLCENHLDSSPQDSKSQNILTTDNLQDSSESSQNDKKMQSLIDENGWLDIIGSGDFKKRVIKSGAGIRPNHGDRVTINITGKSSNGAIVEQERNLKVILGDSDVIQGLDMAIVLMEQGEISEIVIPSRLAYGKLGRIPDIPPNTDLTYEVELLHIEDKDAIELSVAEKIKLGNEKKEKGNFWYSRGDYLNAVQCYHRAAEYLDDTNQNFENPPEELQNLLDTRLKVYNNMAAAHLKMEAYDAALKSVDFVLKIQPKNVKAHFRKGKILAAKGLIDEAINEMKIAVKLEPETKVIHQEISKLLTKKKNEENAQKAMYKRMFGQDKPKPKPSKLRNWSLMVGSILAVALGIAVYRQLHSTG